MIYALGWMIPAFFSGLSAFAGIPKEDEAFVSADDARIVYMGRVSHRIPQAVTFTYPGVSIYADFEGTSLQMKAKPGSGDFMVEIDDGLPYRRSSRAFTWTRDVRWLRLPPCPNGALSLSAIPLRAAMA